MSITASGAVVETDLDGEVSSKELSKIQALLDAEIEAILKDGVNEVRVATENEAIPLDEQVTVNVEAALNPEDLPPQP